MISEPQTITIRKKYSYKEYNARWYRENKERHLALQKKRLSDPVKLAAMKKQAKEYANKEETKQKRRQYTKQYLQRPEILARKQSREHRAKVAAYAKERYRKCVQHKIGTCIRTRIKDALTYNRITSVKKTQHTEELLGCTIEHCKKYLESLFKEGMSWDNYGYRGWHIDHIVPCSAFDLTKVEEQKKCFHYTNLQPLWAKDNLSKGDKLTWSKSNEPSDHGHLFEAGPLDTNPEALTGPSTNSQAAELQAVD